MPNVTIRIDDEGLIRRAKALAAERGTSLSALVREHLEEIVRREDEYEAAREEAMKTLRRGLDIAGPLSRGEIYDGGED